MKTNKKINKVFHKTGRAGIELIKEFEGFRSKPYLDPIGIPTIGYGATYYLDGRRVKMTDPPITKEQGTELLKKMIVEYELSVNTLVKSSINQNQFDALVSFTYNLGAANLKKSTLLKKVNKNPNDLSIEAEFLKWNKAGGRVMAGLTRRRKAEAELYFKL